MVLEKLTRNPDKSIVTALEEVVENSEAEVKELAAKSLDIAQRTLLGEVATLRVGL